MKRSEEKENIATDSMTCKASTARMNGVIVCAWKS